MKKLVSFSVKVIVLTFLLLQMNVFSAIYADMIPTDYFSIENSKDVRKEQLLFNEKVTKSIDNFKSKKTLSLTEKKQYLAEFKSLLHQCLKLEEQIDKQYEEVKQKDHKALQQWHKSYERYYIEKIKVAPQPYDRRLRDRQPQKMNYDEPFKYFYITRYELGLDKQRLKDIIFYLGETDLNLINISDISEIAHNDDSKNTRNYNIFIASFVLILSVISFLALRIIRKNVH